ncbi:MAG TPA: RluA family pseudouridine synthase [Phycisphaerales bacterium]|nr:RluA family pseudouridine synthase [Phycisphaerales bacterium]
MTDPRAQATRDEPDEEVRASLGDRLVLPGGKVDPDAIQRAIERARRSAGEDESGEEELPRVTFTLRRDLGARLDKYLTSRITFMSRTQLQRLIASGGVTVNDRPAKPSTRLFQDDRVEVVVPPLPEKGIRPEEIPLEALYEDEHLIVLNKQPDIIVHPARSELTGTMINALAWRFKHVSGGALSGVGEEFARPGVVHRLDRNTSGCIVFAKSDEAHWKLGRQFERRSVDKRYLALVHGRVEPDGQVIDLPIGPHPSREKGYREKYVVRHDDLGKPSVTICRVRERYGEGDGATERRSDEGREPAGASTSASLRRSVAPSLYSLVELELKTGRTHQIRVHMSFNGWPIVGDDMYGGKPLGVGDPPATIGRQMLHAGLLAFEHPISGEPMVFTAPAPPDLAAAVAELRRRGAEPVHVDGTVPLARFGL